MDHRQNNSDRSDATSKSRITVPVHAHPLARLLFAEMARQRMTYDQLEWDAGVLKTTIKSWRNEKRPGLETIEAALGALGWSILPIPRFDKLPVPLQAELTRLAELYGDLEPITCQLIAAVSRAPVCNNQTKHPRKKRGEKRVVN